MKVGCCCFITASNRREKTVSLFASYTSSKGVSMETMETPLDPPLQGGEQLVVLSPRLCQNGGDKAQDRDL